MTTLQIISLFTCSFGCLGVVLVIQGANIMKYFKHFINTIKTNNFRFIALDDFLIIVERTRTLVYLDNQDSDIILSQPELFDKPFHADIYFELDTYRYRYMGKYLLLSPIALVLATLPLRNKYRSLKRNLRCIKTDVEVLAEIEKGPKYTTEEVKAHIKSKFPWMNI